MSDKAAIPIDEAELYKRCKDLLSKTGLRTIALDNFISGAILGIEEGAFCEEINHALERGQNGVEQVIQKTFNCSAKSIQESAKRLASIRLPKVNCRSAEDRPRVDTIIATVIASCQNAWQTRDTINKDISHLHIQFLGNCLYKALQQAILEKDINKLKILSNVAPNREFFLFQTMVSLLETKNECSDEFLAQSIEFVDEEVGLKDLEDAFSENGLIAAALEGGQSKETIALLLKKGLDTKEHEDAIVGAAAENECSPDVLRTILFLIQRPDFRRTNISTYTIEVLKAQQELHKATMRSNDGIEAILKAIPYRNKCK